MTRHFWRHPPLPFAHLGKNNGVTVICTLLITLIWLVLANSLFASEPVQKKTTPSTPSTGQKPQPTMALNPNIKTKTLGGRQFWADVEYFHKWRIQQNVYTKHYRLLDQDDYRHAWGTRAQCRKRLDEIRVEKKLPPMSGEAVVLIHGLVRSSKSLCKLQQRLEGEGYSVFNLDYPSTRLELTEIASYVQSVIESLEGIEKIHFVVHSLGGLVVRTYLKENDPDRRIGRLVMMATPNLGADLADKTKILPVVRLILGPTVAQMSRNPGSFVDLLPVPGFEFGIIAGGRGNLDGYNPLIPGDDDGTVSVACTRLPGAADFVIVKHLHTFVISAPESLDYTVCFLKQGRFMPDREPHAIPYVAPPTESEGKITTVGFTKDRD